MTNTRTTKRSLITSVIALFLCVAMLAGTTFAWFTDSVASKNNVIKSGNLDIKLEYWNGTEWADVQGQSDILTNTLFEPGVTEVAYLRIANAGSLSLKYQLGINIVSETEGKNVAGNNFKLSDYIYFDVVKDQQPEFESREAAMEFASEISLISAGYSNAGALEPGKDVYLAMVVYMPETVGNVANHDGEHVPEINLGINIIATQVNAEEDSFGSDYDTDSVYCDILATPKTINDVLANVEEGTIVGLANGYYDEIVLTQNNLTLVAAKAVVGFLNLNAKDGTVIDGITFDKNGAKQTYTFATGNNKKATEYAANITGDTDKPTGADNTVIKNCTFTTVSDTAVASAKYYAPIYFNEQGAATAKATNVTVENCVFAVSAHQYVCLNYMGEGEVVIKDNVFGGSTYSTTHNAIQATSNAANWTITGNSFANWNVEKTAIGSSKQGSNKVTWNVSNNKFENVDGSVILALKTSYTADNSVVIVENNTALNGYATITTTPVNAENENVYGGHKIVANEGVSTVASTNDLKSALKNDATIYVTSGEYSLNSLSSYSGITIIGGDDAVVGGENTSTGFASNFGKNTTIKNVTFAGTSNGVRWSYANGGDTVFENCTFAGDSTYGFHIDESKGANFTFNNCTFSGFNAFAGDLKSVTFNNCTFLNNGNYGHTNIWSVAYFNNCTWGEGATYGARGDGKIFIDGFRPASSVEELAKALASDDNVILSGDIAVTGTAQLPDRNNYVEVYGNKTGFAQYAGVIDGNNYEIKDAEGDRSYLIVTHGGTIKNLVIKSGARGIVTYSPKADVIIDNVVVDGAGYALNSAEQAAVNMIVTNSTINGWTSLAGFKSVEFTSCKLGENTLKYWQNMGYDQDYDRLFRVYSPTTFTECEFEQGYYLDMSAGGTATLIDCTVDGVEITAKNYASYITIELPAGKTLADCVTFG